MSAVRRTIFYDGLCQLCSREIDLFRRRVTDGSLAYIDIADPAFNAAAYGVDPVRVHRDMHVRDDETGRMLIGAEAITGMWECVPVLRWAALFLQLPPFRPLARWGYEVFAWVRPKLPKRKRIVCESDRCAVR